MYKSKDDQISQQHEKIVALELTVKQLKQEIAELNSQKLQASNPAELADRNARADDDAFINLDIGPNEFELTGWVNDQGHYATDGAKCHQRELFSSYTIPVGVIGKESTIDESKLTPVVWLRQKDEFSGTFLSAAEKSGSADSGVSEFAIAAYKRSDYQCCAENPAIYGGDAERRQAKPVATGLIISSQAQTLQLIPDNS